MKTLSFFALAAMVLAACGTADRGMKLQPSPHDLVFTELADRWDEAVPLGNAEVGALLWQRGDRLRFSLDRVDLWDLRPSRNFENLENAYAWIHEQWKNNTYEKVQDMFDKPYGRHPAPTKIPAGTLEFDIAGWGEVDSVRLLVHNALCKVWWSDGKTLETFVHATEPCGWFRFTGVDVTVPELLAPGYKPGSEDTNDGISQSNLKLETLGYEQGTVTEEGTTITYVQKGWNDFRYAVSVTWKNTADGIEGVWSVQSTYEGASVNGIAQDVQQALQTGFTPAAGTHQQWWDAFWAKSSISLPDPLLEKQWYLEQYKFGCTARPHTPPISLQAVWTADNGMLPPWKGDFHHDLNTQLSYWPAYSGNHLDDEKGFTDWLWKHREAFRHFARTFYGAGGLNVPGVTTLDGEPMGGWIQYSGSPTVGAWLSHHFWLRWRYTLDRTFLEERAYPWFSETAQFLEEISFINGDGVRQLPLSSSPEVNDNRREAWFPTMTNYDLALVKFAFGKAAELARELGKENEAAHWEKTGREWGDYAVDKDGLMFVASKPYDESHRHFSHQMAFHPLGLLDISQGGEVKQLLETTVNTLEKTGPEIWTGYSYSWMGGLCARIRDGERAARYLTDFAECFCLKNGFHVNGDQCKKGLSRLTYRPFTLEGNMAFASSLQEMLIQSHAGIVEIFPALPAAWRDVSFTTLRTEGAFLVSAEMKDGQVTCVTVESLKGGTLRLRNPIGHEVKVHGATALPGAPLELEMRPGEKIKLK